MMSVALASSFCSAHSSPAVVLYLRPSLWPTTVNVLTTVPSILYLTIVLIAPPEPSGAPPLP